MVRRACDWCNQNTRMPLANLLFDYISRPLPRSDDSRAADCRLGRSRSSAVAPTLSQRLRIPATR